MTTDPAEKPAPATEKWTCAGVRVSSKGSRAVAWQDPHGAIFRYLEKGRYVLGARYEVLVTRPPDDVIRHGKPRYLGSGPADQEQLEEWRAQEVAAEVTLARMARERSALKQDALDDALTPLLRIAATLRTGYDRDAFTAYVIRQLQKGWYQK